MELENKLVNIKTTRSGLKAVIIDFESDVNSLYPIRGYIEDDKGKISAFWTMNGQYKIGAVNDRDLIL